jgi:hypothetical protein
MTSVCAWLDLPDTLDAKRLRAGLMAADILPQVLHVHARSWPHQLGATPAVSSGVLIVDVSADVLVPGRPLDRLLAAVPEPWRPRTHLTRLAGGHVSPADRAWIRALGFAGLWSDLGRAESWSGLAALLDAVARPCGVAPPSAATLARFVQVLQPGASDTESRARVHAMAGCAPETLAGRWADGLPIADRRHRLREWARCFVGSEAVDGLVQTHGLTRPEAVALGQAMQALGLLTHVTADHPFQDAGLFYRLAWSAAADAVPLDQALADLADPAVLPVRSRLYRGRSYANCWVGQEAVDRVAQRWSVDRVDAWIVLHRLGAWGCFEHVLRERPFIDGEFFYRWRPPR